MSRSLLIPLFDRRGPACRAGDPGGAARRDRLGVLPDPGRSARRARRIARCRRSAGNAIPARLSAVPRAVSCRRARLHRRHRGAASDLDRARRHRDVAGTACLRVSSGGRSGRPHHRARPARRAKLDLGIERNARRRHSRWRGVLHPGCDSCRPAGHRSAMGRSGRHARRRDRASQADRHHARRAARHRYPDRRRSALADRCGSGVIGGVCGAAGVLDAAERSRDRRRHLELAGGHQPAALSGRRHARHSRSGRHRRQPDRGDATSSKRAPAAISRRGSSGRARRCRGPSDPEATQTPPGRSCSPIRSPPDGRPRGRSA